MELRDIIVTPVTIMIIYVIAYMIRPYLVDRQTVTYFFPALTIKIIGALAVGFIYQFYYQGGDTYNYHTHGSRILWNALMDDPSTGVELFFNSDKPDLYRYTSEILFYLDPSSFFVVKVSAFIDLFTFSSYSATAVWFALLSFIGMWYFFKTFYELFPHLHFQIALASFFIPSVFFWGSGLLKDTIVMASLGLSTYLIKKLFIDKNIKVIFILTLMLNLYIVFSVKKYVLLCFMPAALFWIYVGNLSRISSPVLRILLFPIFILITLLSGVYAVQKLAEGDSKYALDKIAETARVTAYDIRYYTGKDAGSGYSLGELDGSFSSMLRLAPQAINVSLFRPYPWEVKNLLMLLSSLEALLFLLITLLLFFRRARSFFKAIIHPSVLFCLIFSLTFAFAVGVSTYNFGTLSRYKIPLLPFYAMVLVLIWDQENKERKLREFDLTE